jgi:plastocyanin
MRQPSNVHSESRDQRRTSSLTGRRRQSAVSTCLVGAAAAAGLFAAAVPVTVAIAGGSAGITITSGACSGGGTTFCFSRESVTVVAGSSVTWTNRSGVSHTATSCTPSACAGAPASTGRDTFNVSIGTASGSSGSFTFTSPGSYYYYCAIHGYAAMHGHIIVTAKQSPPSPTPTQGGAPNSPSTGAAPGPLGVLAIVFGIVVIALAAAFRRR